MKTNATTTNDVKVLTFNEVYEQHYNTVLSYIRFKINNSADAEELAQDVFVKISGHLDNYKPELSAMSTWIRNITNHTIIDYFRTDKSGHFVSIENFTDDKGRSTFQPLDTYRGFQVEDKEMKSRLRRAFRALSPNYRRIAVLYFLKDKQYNEIAELCMVPMGTVKGMLSRARVTLQEQLQGVMAEAMG